MCNFYFFLYLCTGNMNKNPIIALKSDANIDKSGQICKKSFII